MPKTLFVGSTKAGQTRVEDSPFYGTIPNPSVQKEGILSVAVADDGAITPGAFFPLDTHIGWIERHPSNGLIYAAGGGRLFSLKEANCTLHRLTTAETIGDPCHFTISADGKWALAASYGGGTLCVIPILADGILGAATDSKLHTADCLVRSLPACPRRRRPVIGARVHRRWRRALHIGWSGTSRAAQYEAHGLQLELVLGAHAPGRAAITRTKTWP